MRRYSKENDDRCRAVKDNLAGVRGSLLLVLLVISVLLASCEVMDPESLKGGETRQTLSPAYFSGKTAKAYVAAKEIPEVIDSLYCYCDCKKHHGHKSLLTCYVDTHARYCDVCIDEALDAHKMHKDGKDIVTIRKAIDKKYKSKRH
jgi:hypothetical protein